MDSRCRVRKADTHAPHVSVMMGMRLERNKHKKHGCYGHQSRDREPVKVSRL